LATNIHNQNNPKLVEFGAFSESENKAVEEMVNNLKPKSDVGGLTRFFKYIFKFFSYTFKIYTIDKLVEEQYSTGYNL
jgi:hypothetical protein